MQYMNEWDRYACKWLRKLIKSGLLPAAYVDQRDVRDVKPEEVKKYTQCHYFAGIGGWPLALRLAGWPEESVIWSASLPCQPFSTAGKRKGEADERHLWPDFFTLVRQCLPPIIVGEQVASKDGIAWVDRVRADLEKDGYAVGVADLPAACVNAPHIRQRLFWVAVGVGQANTDSNPGTANLRAGDIPRDSLQKGGRQKTPDRPTDSSIRSDASGVSQADTTGTGCECTTDRRAVSKGMGSQQSKGGSSSDAFGVGLADTKGITGRNQSQDNSDGGRWGGRNVSGKSGSGSGPVGLGHPNPTGPQGLRGRLLREPQHSRGKGEVVPTGDANATGGTGGVGNSQDRGYSKVETIQEELFRVGGGESIADSGWRLIQCRDGKYRRIPVESRFQPLAHAVPSKSDDPRMGYLLARLEALGHSTEDAKGILRIARRNRVGRLKGYGNAIVPPAAVVFIQSVMDVLGIKPDER